MVACMPKPDSNAIEAKIHTVAGSRPGACPSGAVARAPPGAAGVAVSGPGASRASRAARAASSRGVGTTARP